MSPNTQPSHVQCMLQPPIASFHFIPFIFILFTSAPFCIGRADIGQHSLDQPVQSSVTRIHEQTHGSALHTLPSDVVHENRVLKLLQMASIIWQSSFHGYGWSELTPLQGARQSESQTWSSCLLSQQLMPLLG